MTANAYITQGYANVYTSSCGGSSKIPQISITVARVVSDSPLPNVLIVMSRNNVDLSMVITIDAGSAENVGRALMAPDDPTKFIEGRCAAKIMSHDIYVSREDILVDYWTTPIFNAAIMLVFHMNNYKDGENCGSIFMTPEEAQELGRKICQAAGAHNN